MNRACGHYVVGDYALDPPNLPGANNAARQAFVAQEDE